ncbi:hypothetical protein DdX_12538 [Ditylenchus destructor]|uniref:F-box domain-containing protein n=1 Tax=Ditylenchus destructor TaxID=166010 RepID=A0AAD4N055_9BILA|nr:hypothetical protein DdX_12538 [Ditylenchus destructor]
MDDDILIDVFRPLSRKLLAQSVEQVCRRFRHLVNSPALPNLHIVNEFGIIEKIYTISDGFQASYRPPKYLRFQSVHIKCANCEYYFHLDRENFEPCLWQFRHCFVDCHLHVSIPETTAAEFQSFLVERFLPLFSNCIYSFIMECVRRNNDERDRPTKTLFKRCLRFFRFKGIRKSLKSSRTSANVSADGLPPSSAVANLNSGASDQQTTATSPSFTLLISHPSILNCMYLSLWVSRRYSEPFIPIDNVIQWLHHSPTVPTTTTTKNWWKSKRNLHLDASMLEDLDTEQSHIRAVSAANNLVKKIKERFLAGNASKEKCDFHLEILLVQTRNSKLEIPEFDIRNDATNESLKLEVKEDPYEGIYDYMFAMPCHTYTLTQKTV